jgi:uncharacterized damage-inducible protein DinB
MTYAGLNEWPEPPIRGDEAATLLGSLDRQRATFAWKTGGLDAEGLRATVGASSITLGGLLKHLALVEDYYFSVRLFDREHASPFNALGAQDDGDWEWSSAATDEPEYLYDLWQRMVDQSRRNVAAVLADEGLDYTMKQTWPDGRSPSLRRTLVDLIEEYARHVGHADLIRESVDGVVGEDPPGVHD